MATKKKGVLSTSGEWWRHLRWTKRLFWKKHRKAEKRAAKEHQREMDL